MGEPACTAGISNAQVAEAGGSTLALLAVADAAEAARSPVIVGFSAYTCRTRLGTRSSRPVRRDGARRLP
jgi:hypothetical protein